MSRRCHLMLVAVALLVIGRTARFETGQIAVAEEAGAGIEVVNEAGKKLIFKPEDVAQLPQKEITAKDHRGNEAKFSGVPLHEILKKAEVALGPQLRGKLLANCLVVEAADEYRVAFSLPEVDPDWTCDIVLLATTRDGQALDKDHGPYQLIVAGEKRHSRWVKRVTRLTIHKLAP